MQYGYFDDEKREYVITNPRTPVKWINYIGTLAFGGFVDHTGGAVICRQDPSLNRIVKYIPQLPASDFRGETLYLRVKQAGVYKRWEGFRATRKFRKATYHIHVTNLLHVCQGVKLVRVDGKKVAGAIVPVFGDGGTHTVEVVMGI